MQVRLCVYGAITFSVVSSGELCAQRLVRVEPGDRVRVQSLSRSGSFERSVNGTVARVEGDTVLFITPDQGEALEVHAFDHRVRVDAHTGRRSATTPGAAVGAFLGGAAGAVIGLGFADQCEPPELASDPACIEGGPEALLGGAIGVGSGLALGIVVGSLIKRDRWTPVRGFPTVEPTFWGSRSGAGLGLSIGF